MASPKTRVTLKDIASAAGVSHSAASRILNGNGGGHSEATCVHVRAIAALLGYQPRAQAVHPRPGTRATVALVTLPGAGLAARMMEDALVWRLAASYLFIPVITPLNFADPASFPETLSRLGVAATLFCASGHAYRLLSARLPAGIRQLMVNPAPDQLDGMADELRPAGVTTDRAAGVARAVDHLVSLGHTRIGMHTSDLESTKLSGYLRAMETHRLAVTDDLLLRTHSWPSAEGLELGRALACQIREAVEPPSAVITLNDHIAMSLMGHLQAAGRRVPHDISIVGFDGIDAAAHSSPGLTTVAQPFERLAQAAVQMLERWAQTNQPPACGLALMEPELVVRGSTGPVSRAPEEVGTD